MSTTRRTSPPRALDRPERPRWRIAALALLALACLTVGLAGREAPARAAGPRPPFQIPFPCGETWYASSRPGHKAIDWNLYGDADAGKPVVASADGLAYVDEEPGGWGSYVLIDHGDGWWTVYAHLLAEGRRSGRVRAGDRIGLVGSTGRSTGEHLHWEQWKDEVKQSALYADGVAVEPWESLPGRAYESRNCANGGGSIDDPIDGSGSLDTDGYEPVTPLRLLDTRDTGNYLRAGSTVAVAVAGVAEQTGGVAVPADAEAAVLNVTAVDPRTDGYVTVRPCGAPSTETSTVNYTAGNTTPNLAVSGPGDDGAVCISSSAPIHLVVDLQGWFAAGSGVTPLTPTRLLDTRTEALVEPGVPLRLQAAPAGTSAAALNLTVTDPYDAAFLSAWPCDEEWPGSSNVNVIRRETRSNLALAGLAADGSVCLLASAPSHVVVDATARFAAETVYRPVVPARTLDTREGVGAPERAVRAGEVVRLQAGGVGGVPRSAEAVAVNVTVAEPAADGYLTVFPCGTEVPLASNLNFRTKEAKANLVVSGLDESGGLCLYSPVTTHIVADVQGWFLPT
jgi:murein DD-endopeptidase MepM/ murein hydrolase activator NlpD